MYFDTSPRTLNSLALKLRQDPRVIRWTMLKQGEKIQDMVLPREKTVMRMDYLKPLKENSWSDIDSF
jgi:small subunit ribosomal protein S6